MLKKIFILALFTLGVISDDDMSHPHSSESLTHNLRTFEFPDGSQHGKTCQKQ
jgi:hypothetical protein